MADILDRLRTVLADRYTIEREIGSGGMATVYLAESLGHERLAREIQAPVSFNHPHILISEESGGPSIAPARGLRGAGFKANRTRLGVLGQ